jgi:hypothetical protein
MKLTNKPTGHHYITSEGTVLNTKDGGKADSLGRTARAMMVYDEDKYELRLGVHSYFENGAVYRHPDWAEYNSRDHAVIALSCLKQIGDFKGCTSSFWKVFKTFPRFTLGQRIWLKAMFSKPWSIVYLIYKLPGLAVLYPMKNYLLRRISRTLKTYENPRECKVAQLINPPTKWQKFCFKLTLKAYASFYTLYEINAIESNLAKRILQKVMILHFEKSNYVARAMCGQQVIYPIGYLPSRNNRWSVRLDRTCDRSMQPYNDTEEDNLEMGMLRFYCG